MMTARARVTMHATCLRVGPAGVLLLGPPGAGKSALALALLDAPGYATGQTLLKARLVADDQVVIEREGAGLTASAPETLAGLLEVRGLGLVHVENLPSARLHLAVKLIPRREIERLPEPEVFSLLDAALPLARLDPESPHAPARLRAAIAHLGLA